MTEPSSLSACVAIFAHNEERRIAACLASLPLDRTDIAVHVLVNGSRDNTAAIGREWASRHPSLTIHDWPQGGKARSWNRFIHEVLTEPLPRAIIGMDGDAVILPGSFDALLAVLDEQPRANAVAGLPRNGRRMGHYQALLRDEGGLFGDLYALRGSFVSRIRDAGLRLPQDVIGEDGLVAAFAATDLGPDANWDRARLTHAETGGFLCEPVSLLNPHTLVMQHKRLIAYATRHFQNRIISAIMGREGPSGLPDRLAPLYAQWLDKWTPGSGPINAVYDRLALKRLARAAEAEIIPG